MGICVIGGGIAGALLAWRLAQHAAVDEVWLAPGPAAPADATAASGGAVRCYETDPVKRELAIDSMVELLADDTLRDWAGYQVTGCTYVPPIGTEIAGAITEIEDRLPGSASPLTATELAERGWHQPQVDTVAVFEREAGYLNPQRLRRSVLADLAGRGRVHLLPDGPVSGLDAGSFELTGRRHSFDSVVLATGAWTPALLAGAGLSTGDLRSKGIQYTIFQTSGWSPATFVDEPTGLYGKPAGSGLLLGLPTETWDAPATGIPADLELARSVAELAGSRFPRLRLDSAAPPVTALDCYTEIGQLALRPVPDTADRLFTFTGGSGGAAKTVLAASLRAAIQLAEGHRYRPEPTPTLIGRRSESS